MHEVCIGLWQTSHWHALHRIGLDQIGNPTRSHSINDIASHSHLQTVPWRMEEATESCDIPFEPLRCFDSHEMMNRMQLGGGNSRPSIFPHSVRSLAKWKGEWLTKVSNDRLMIVFRVFRTKKYTLRKDASLWELLGSRGPSAGRVWGQRVDQVDSITWPISEEIPLVITYQWCQLINPNNMLILRESYRMFNIKHLWVLAQTTLPTKLFIYLDINRQPSYGPHYQNSAFLRRPDLIPFRVHTDYIVFNFFRDLKMLNFGLKFQINCFFFLRQKWLLFPPGYTTNRIWNYFFYICNLVTQAMVITIYDKSYPSCFFFVHELRTDFHRQSLNSDPDLTLFLGCRAKSDECFSICIPTDRASFF